MKANEIKLGQPVSEPIQITGHYIFFHKKVDNRFDISFKRIGEGLLSHYNYYGPFTFEVEEPMPQLRKYRGVESMCISTSALEWVCYVNSFAISCTHKDKRKCIEAFNAMISCLQQ